MIERSELTYLLISTFFNRCELGTVKIYQYSFPVDVNVMWGAAYRRGPRAQEQQPTATAGEA